MILEFKVKDTFSLFCRQRLPTKEKNYIIKKQKVNNMEDLGTEEFIQTCFQIEQFAKIKPILSSKMLTNDKVLQQELMHLISEKKALENISYDELTVEAFEMIIRKIPEIDRMFLLRIEDSNYIEQNINCDKIIESILLIKQKFYDEDDDYLCLSLLPEYIDQMYSFDEYYPTDQSEGNKLKMAIVICKTPYNQEICSHFLELYKKNNFLTEDPYVIEAMLKVKSAKSQDRFLRFLKKEEVRKELKNPNSFYRHFLCEKLDEEEELGDIKLIFEPYKEPEIYANFFDNYSLQYIYFYIENRFHRVPTIFYQQFAKNAFLGDYLGQIYDEEMGFTPFADEEVVAKLVDEDCEDKAAMEILRLGIGKSPKYNIDEEIKWSILFLSALENIEENNELEKSIEETYKVYTK